MPHTFFAKLYEERRDLFDRWIRGPLGATDTFWKVLHNSPITRDHDGLKKPEYLPKTVPLGLHGDGGSFSHQDSLFVLSWNGLLGHMGGETGLGKRWLYTVIRKKDLIPATWHELWRVFAWSMNCLLTGITPSIDWDLKEMHGGRRYIAEGWRGALIQVRGDWEFLANVVGLPHWGAGDNMCWMCHASNTDPALKWQDGSAEAGWRRRRRTHASWKEELRGALPTIFLMTIGLSIGCVMVDTLHAVDLGVASHVAGNVFRMCLDRNVWQGGNLKNNAAKLSSEIEEWHRTTKTKSKLQGDLTPERLKSTSGYPKLKAKGAATRHLMEFVHMLAVKYLSDDRRIAALTFVLVKFFKLIESEGMFLSKRVAADIAAVGRQFCMLYYQLSSEAAGKFQKRWKATPKIHMFQHMCEWQVPELLLNPRSYWTYADEDLVGKLMEMDESAHVLTLAVTSISKWLLNALD